MIINQQEFSVKEVNYTIRPAIVDDAKVLSELRVQIDSETENLDREPGEGFIDVSSFEQLIIADTENPRNLFLVAVVNDRLVGFSSCEGNLLRRFAHKVELGVCVLQEFWGYSIGNNLIKESISWADSIGIHKISLNVLETNDSAIRLYKKLGFRVEGVLKDDKVLSDGKFYNTVVMGRWNE